MSVFGVNLISLFPVVFKYGYIILDCANTTLSLISAFVFCLLIKTNANFIDLLTAFSKTA